MATITVPSETPKKQVVVGGTPQTSVTFDFVIFEMKFELVGRDSNPITYIKNVLVTGLRKIQGIDIQDIQSRPEKLS